MTRTRAIRRALIFIAASLFAACGGDDDRAAAPNLLLSDQQLNIAHRGGNRLAPEETLEAWRSALAVGADVLEMDLHATADGVLVLLHDGTVNRTTDGEGRIRELSWAEVQELDAGYDHTRDGGETYPFRGQGVHIPSLEEVFTEFADQYMVIEIKQSVPSIVDAFDAMLTRMNMRERVVVASFNDDTIAEFRAKAPDVLTSYSLDEATELFLLSEEDEESYTPPARFLQVPPDFQGVEVLVPEFIAKARRLGLKFHVWGDINAPETMRELLDLGMDGLIVDDPETLAEILASR